MLHLEASFHKGLFGPSATRTFNQEKWLIKAGQVILSVSHIYMGSETFWLLVSVEKEEDVNIGDTWEQSGHGLSDLRPALTVKILV